MKFRVGILWAGSLAVLAVLVGAWLVRSGIAAREAATVADVRALAVNEKARRAEQIASNERAALADVRAVVAAQAAYRAVNGGFYASRLECLAQPWDCIPYYPANAPAFLDARLVHLGDRSGYLHLFTAGSSPGSLPASVSPDSVTTYRYEARPLSPGLSGVRTFTSDEMEAADGALPPPPVGVTSAAGQRDLLRVRSARVGRSGWAARMGKPFYSLLVTVENTSERPVVLLQMRRIVFRPDALPDRSDSTAGLTRRIGPGESLTLGEDEAGTRSNAADVRFLCLVLRYGDDGDYRTNRSQILLFKLPGTGAGEETAELTLLSDAEAAPLRTQLLTLGGWWGEAGPEQGLAAAASKLTPKAAAPGSR